MTSSSASSKWSPTFSDRSCRRSCPRFPNLELAAYYRTSRWAGGDYYDFFPLPDGRWGILVADVSGHGTPAAVMMAITHSLAHSLPGPADPPAALLGHLNRQLSMHYTVANEVFVTAFYGIYDPAARTLTYSSAGHNPPRLIRCRDGTVQSLEEVGGPPLGLVEDLEYEQTTCELQARRRPGVLHRRNHRGHGCPRRPVRPVAAR